MIKALPGVKAFYHEQAAVNVLSCAELEDLGWRISKQDGDKFYILRTPQHFKRQLRFIFNRKGKHYVCNFRSLDNRSDRRSAFPTVSQNELKYTKREVAEAKEAAKAVRILAFPSDKDTIQFIRAGSTNAPISADAVYRKSDIYGADIPALKGKSTQSTPPAVKPEYLRTHEAQVPQVLHVDIMFIARMPFLVCVAEPLGLTIIGDLGDTKSAAQVKPQLWFAIASLKARGFVVNQVRSDRDGAISKLAVELGKEGIHYDPSGTAQHVPIVERKIRVIKERARAVLASLHFPLPRDLLPYLVKYCVIYINMNQSNTRVDNVSPYEAFTGRKYDWKQYGKVVMVVQLISETNK